MQPERKVDDITPETVIWRKMDIGMMAIEQKDTNEWSAGPRVEIEGVAVKAAKTHVGRP